MEQSFTLNLNSIIFILVLVIIAYIGFRFLDLVGKIIGSLLSILVIAYIIQKLGIKIHGIEGMVPFMENTLDTVVKNLNNILKSLRT